MSKTVFTKVDYDLGTLVKFIGLGEIGLPDIQRPFVWKNAKVRDLFDSMYKGYPVGYLLLWQNEVTENLRTIGTEAKQKIARLVIVDGQQRLTSLFAVIKNAQVVRKNFEREHIRIAFNPLEEKFEVADAAICRDKSYLPDISILWNEQTDLFEVVEEYIAGLSESREVSTEETKKIRKAISGLQGLTSFPLTALELAPDIDEEAVSDVFVRINGTGTPLNQADFILTLMSVFWDEGRTELETFSRESRKPSKDGPSPFNHFIEPSPDQLLRVSVGVAFKRARLRYVYSILRGKDLETEKFSTEQRIKQFEILKDAQKRTLNLTYWHDFMSCIRNAGYRSGKMISSQNNLLFSYILYIIGRTEYKAPEHELRKTITRWFFMSSLTGRFTGSPESAMEFDLARFREVDTAEEFLQILNQVCDTTLTDDFWNVRLPIDLATSSSRSPSLFAYNAALVLLDVRALFSNQRISDLLDPSISSNRSLVERHHLFPKEYLKIKGITSTRDTNQIANYAYLEWGDNVDIGGNAPSEYFPQIKERFSQGELDKMYHYHALPIQWENMEYRDFLEERRELIAQVIAEGFKSLSFSPREIEAEKELNIEQLVRDGESEALEFKSTLRINLHTGRKDPKMELAILKTLAGFLNTSSGTLIIGVADDGSPIGLEIEQFENEDKLALHLVSIIKSRMGMQAMSNIHLHFEDYHDDRVLVVNTDRIATPVFVLDEEKKEHFYIRTGPSTSELTPSQTQEYIKQRFK
jgi:hypothetical protein